MNTRIRQYDESDGPELAELFFQSIHRGASSHYSPAQRRAWAPDVPDPELWNERLSALDTHVAEDRLGIAGFMALDSAGYIDLAFVRPDRIGSGVGTALLCAVECSAATRQLKRLTSHASDLARHLFERHGWHIVSTQQVARQGVYLTNHFMEKNLR